MAAMNVSVVISAMDRFTPTLDRLEKRLRGLDRYGGRLGPGGGFGPGGGSDSRGGGHVGWRQPEQPQPNAAPSRGRGSTVASLGIPAPLLGAGAAGLGLKEVISQAADFQSALTDIRKKGGYSAEQTAALGEEIKDLATNGELAVPIEEIASAYERGAAAGLPLGDLREFARLSAMAADAFEMSAEDVGNSAAGFNTVLNIPIGEMEKYFDLINSLADSGIADESDLVNFLDRAGASLKLFGLTAQESAAYAATFANIKMAPDVGANALSTLTGKLLSPGSEKAEMSLEKIVGDTNAFRKLLRTDPNKALLTFLDRVGELDKFQATELLGGLVGAGFDDEILRLATSVDEARRNLALAAGDSWFGSLGQAYDLKLQNFWSQWQIAKSALAELTIDVGTAGMPVFMGALAAAKAIVEDIDAGFSAMKLGLNTEDVNAVKAAVEGLVGAITGLMSMGSDDLSPLQAYFAQLTDAANFIAGGVGMAQDGAQAIGLADPDEETPEQRAERRSRVYDAGAGFLSRTPVGRAAESLPDLVIPEGEERSQWMGDYEASGAAYAPSSDPAFEARVRAREAARAAAAPEEIVLDEIVVPPAYIPTPPPEMNLAPPPIESVPIPIQRPELDTAAYLLSADQLTAARAGIEAPIQSTADVNITPAMAKLATLRAEAAATAQAVSASLAGAGGGAGGGDASRFKARVRDQF